MRLLELTRSCNNACLFCSQADERARPYCARDASIEALLQGVQGEDLAIVGGEPTLEARLVGLAARARGCGARGVWVQTNGRRLAYKAYARELHGAGVMALEVSIQGSCAAMHDYHTRVDGSFAQTLRGIAHAAEAGMRVGVSTVVTRSNLRHLDALVRVVHAAGAIGLRLRRVRAVGGALERRQRLVPAPAIAAGYLSEARAAGDRLRLAVYFERVDDPTQPFVDWVGGPQEQRAGAAHVSQGPVAVRARTALGESRGHDRLSGEALRDILPGLFESSAHRR